MFQKKLFFTFIFRGRKVIFAKSKLKKAFKLSGKIGKKLVTVAASGDSNRLCTGNFLNAEPIILLQNNY